MLRLIIFLSSITVCWQVMSSSFWLYGTVTRTLVDTNSWGECMAKIVPGPHTVQPACGVEWVTFSCSGDFNTKARGHSKLESAQLAMVTGKPIAIWVDETKKHNGYCFGRRVDVLKE